MGQRFLNDLTMMDFLQFPDQPTPREKRWGRILLLPQLAIIAAFFLWREEMSSLFQAFLWALLGVLMSLGIALGNTRENLIKSILILALLLAFVCFAILLAVLLPAVLPI
jgi:uncharacterized protein YybS (DUF2232 family)